MHRGVETGDKLTEDQANRFASAFYCPEIFVCARVPRGHLLNWKAIYELKLRWKVSAAAIIRRAYDLRMISADQYRTGYIHLSKTGQKRVEYYDDKVPLEEPELLLSAMDALENAFPGSVRRIASEVGLDAAMFENVPGVELPQPLDSSASVIMFKRSENRYASSSYIRRCDGDNRGSEEQASITW